MLRSFNSVRAGMLVLLVLFVAGLCGCGQNTDASDPDPHYYKGKHFAHKRTG